MSRLTKTYLDGTHGASDSLPCGENSYDYKNLLIDKLGEYEDLEEQRRLVKLPCKVGDVVYYVCNNRVMSSEVLSVKYHAEAENHGVFIREKLTVDFEGLPAEIDFNTIGKTVFLTRDEAEAKLKELRCNND